MQQPRRERAPRNTAELRGAMASGRTMGKRASEDPGAVPLGTDDEAAGTPPNADEIEIAMRHESLQPVAPVQRRVAPGAGVLILAVVIVAAIVWLSFG